MEIEKLVSKDEKRDKPVTVRLPKSVVEKMKVMSDKVNCSQSELIEYSIEKLGYDILGSLGQSKVYQAQDGLKYIDTTLPVERELRENKVVSLFSGAGGLDIGLEQAGFETAVCVEIDKNCRETLRYNRPEWSLIEDTKDGSRVPGDIRDVSVDEILKAGNLKKGEAALVVGGAPCQPFSNIGKKLGEDCPKNGDLFLEFVRVIEGVLPKGFIFENVSGITQKKHYQVLEYMKDQFKGLGYSISAVVLNSANYNVPQKRERFIILGIRGSMAPAFPLPSNFKNKIELKKFSDNFEDKLPLKFKKWTSIKKAFSKIPKSYKKRNDYAVMNISPEVKERMTYIGPNENFKVVPKKLLPNCWKSGKHQGADTFGRLDYNDVSVTIRTAAYNPSKGKYIHPIEDRGLDTLELAAIQTFPSDWSFKVKGREKVTLVSGGMQIGNAVPCEFARFLGEAMKRQIDF
jgi:DNA (cytosine-5)-methyltransferase 1